MLNELVPRQEVYPALAQSTPRSRTGLAGHGAHVLTVRVHEAFAMLEEPMRRASRPRADRLHITPAAPGNPQIGADVAARHSCRDGQAEDSLLPYRSRAQIAGPQAGDQGRLGLRPV
jgi:hypothetical protein